MDFCACFTAKNSDLVNPENGRRLLFVCKSPSSSYRLEKRLGYLMTRTPTANSSSTSMMTLELVFNVVDFVYEEMQVLSTTLDKDLEIMVGTDRHSREGSLA